MFRVHLKLFSFCFLKKRGNLFLSKLRTDELSPNCSTHSMQMWESDKDLDYSFICFMQNSRSQLQPQKIWVMESNKWWWRPCGYVAGHCVMALLLSLGSIHFVVKRSPQWLQGFCLHTEHIPFLVHGAGNTNFVSFLVFKNVFLNGQIKFYVVSVHNVMFGGMVNPFCPVSTAGDSINYRLKIFEKNCTCMEHA